MSENTTSNMYDTQANTSEVFRATIGFDFIFSSTNDGKVPLCIEMNGADTGLKGVATIPSSDLSESERRRVEHRMTHTKERLELSAYASSLDPATEPEEVRQAWAKARSVPGFEHAFVNTQEICEIVENKKTQQKFIPPEHRPRYYQEGDSPVSQTGFWICKPVAGRKGKGIQIVSNEEFEKTFLVSGEQTTHIAQEFVRASGADNATPDMKDNPAAMRLLMDFVYHADGTVQEVFTFAYQRVSPHAPHEEVADSELEKVYVVNVAQEAAAATASKEEFEKAHVVALKIIHNLSKLF